MKNNEININQHDLVFYFFNIAGFTISNNIVIDNDTRQPITYNGKYITYNPESTTVIGHSMVQLDVTKNNKINEILFNYWSAKQPINDRYVRFFNLMHSTNRHSQASEAMIEMMDLDEYKQPCGESVRYETPGMMANDVIAFAYLITVIEEADTTDILQLNQQYLNYYKQGA